MHLLFSSPVTHQKRGNEPWFVVLIDLTIPDVASINTHQAPPSEAADTSKGTRTANPTRTLHLNSHFCDLVRFLGRRFLPKTTKSIEVLVLMIEFRLQGVFQKDPYTATTFCATRERPGR